MNLHPNFVTYQTRRPALQRGMFEHAWTEVCEQQYATAKRAGHPTRRLGILPEYVISVRRWTNGINTLHTVEITNDTHSVMLRDEKVVGASTTWLSTSLRLMQKRPDLFPLVAERLDPMLTTRLLSEIYNIDYHVTDVALKREL